MIYFGGRSTRFVNRIPWFEVNPFTILYIYPPHHGVTQFTVMVICKINSHPICSNWFACYLFHINQTNNPWDRAISKFDLEKSKVKFMGEVKVQGHIVDLVFFFHQTDQAFLRYGNSMFEPSQKHLEFEQQKLSQSCYHQTWCSKGLRKLMISLPAYQ